MKTEYVLRFTDTIHVPEDPNGRKLLRSKVPGGWLLMPLHKGVASVVFVADPEHEWELDNMLPGAAERIRGSMDADWAASLERDKFRQAQAEEVIID